MTIEYRDIVRVDSKKIESIVKHAVNFIIDKICPDIGEDIIYFEINRSSLIKELNISEELFDRIISRKLELILITKKSRKLELIRITKKIEMKIGNTGLYFLFRDEMKVYEMRGCIISDGEIYRFHPERFYGHFFKEYKKFRIIIQEIKENDK